MSSPAAGDRIRVYKDLGAYNADELEEIAERMRKLVDSSNAEGRAILARLPDKGQKVHNRLAEVEARIQELTALQLASEAGGFVDASPRDSVAHQSQQYPTQEQEPRREERAQPRARELRDEQSED